MFIKPPVYRLLIPLPLLLPEITVGMMRGCITCFSLEALEVVAGHHVVGTQADGDGGFTENLEKQRTSRRPSQMMMDSYQSGIDKTNERINALKESTPAELAKYEGRNGSDILAIVVRCTYTIDEPVTNKRAAETFDFYLSPDGTKCYSRKRVKE